MQRQRSNCILKFNDPPESLTFSDNFYGLDPKFLKQCYTYNCKRNIRQQKVPAISIKVQDKPSQIVYLEKSPEGYLNKREKKAKRFSNYIMSHKEITPITKNQTEKLPFTKICSNMDFSNENP